MYDNNIKVALGNGFLAPNFILNESNILDNEQLIDLVKNETYKHLDKTQRPTLTQSLVNSRPQNNRQEYLNWSGFQPIDLDISNKRIAPIAKLVLEKLLSKYHWVHSISLSTSGNGLHIYTFTKPLDLPDTSEISSNIMYEYYMDAFEYKLMIIWKACVLAYDILVELDDIDNEDAKYIHPIYNIEIVNKPGETSKQLVDVTIARISQLLVVTADSSIKVSENFRYDELMLPEVLGLYENVNISKYNIEHLRNEFNRIRNRYNVTIKDGVAVYSENHEFDDSFKDNIEFSFDSLDQLYSNCVRLNHDNTKRYRLAYTLAYLFDVKKHNDDFYNEVELIFLKICSGNPKYNREKNQWANAFKSAVDRNIAGSCPCIYSSLTELRDIHHFDIVINVDREQQAARISAKNSDDELANFILKQTDYSQFLKTTFTHTLQLKYDEYIGTYADKIDNVIQHGINALIAPPGFGKTEFIKKLSVNNRVMLVEPYTSIISSKIENSDLGFECFYGDKPLNLSKAVNCALTFDKLTKADADEVSMLYDYVAIDEAHLLSSSSYRGTVPADVINLINKLNTKVIIMTGTPIAEHLFMNIKTSINVYRTETYRNKHMSFVICESNHDKLTKIAMHIARAIDSGKKILFPTNKGNEYLERITAAAKAFCSKPINSKYYKKENNLADFVDSINNQGTIGDVDLLFCSNYLSVGVDINDIVSFDVIYDEDFTAQEIEQFNCRLRKLNIESYLYFSRVDSSGMPKDITNYQELSLDISYDEDLTFEDIRRLHLNGDTSEAALFDFFKYAFNTPYFIKDRLTGEVHVHTMCYRLHKFEEKWRAWAQQYNIISTVLQEYGYECYVTNDIAEDERHVEVAVEAAKAAASVYRQHRNDLTSQFIDLADDESFFEFIINANNSDIVDSDRFAIVKRKNDLKLLIADSKIFAIWRKIFRTLTRYYKHSSIISIIDNVCYDGKGYNVSAAGRLIDALRVIQNAEDEKLADSNLYIIDFIINKIFDASYNKVVSISKEERAIVHMKIASTYIKHSAPFAESVQFKQRIESLSARIFAALTQKVEKDQYALITLPPFDSVKTKHDNNVLNSIMTLFGENAAIVQATVSTNELSESIAKTMHATVHMGVSDNDTDDISKHIVINTDEINKRNLLNYVNEIDVDDYKFKKALEAATAIEAMNNNGDFGNNLDIAKFNTNAAEFNDMLSNIVNNNL